MKTLTDTQREEIIARLIDKPESLSHDDIAAIQNDTELADLYNAAVLCKEASASNDVHIPDVEAELIRFKASRKPPVTIRRWQPIMRVAAMIAIVIVTSIVVVASLRPHLFDNMLHSDTANDELTENVAQETVAISHSTGVVITNTHELVYDDCSFEEIANGLAETYQINIVFKNNELRKLRLHLKIDSGKTILDVTEMLNAFDKFVVEFDSNTLTIK